MIITSVLMTLMFDLIFVLRGEIKTQPHLGGLNVKNLGALNILSLQATL